MRPGRRAVPAGCDDGRMAAYESDGVVLRTIRYGEADAVLSVYTRERGRVSAIAKGARKPTSKLGGRLQPGVLVHLMLHEGRGDMATIRGASVVRTHAGLWVEGYRLRAAGCVLETALRGLPEHEASEPTFNLLVRTLDLLSECPPRDTPPRLEPLVLGFAVKLLVVGGLLPRLGECAVCGAGPPLVGFSAQAGGALCPSCARAGEPLEPEARDAFAALVGRPLAEAAEACPPHAAMGVERLVGLVLREHLGVTLKSATPV